MQEEAEKGTRMSSKNSWGEVMTMENGEVAEVTPLLQDRGALASIALFAVLVVALVLLNL